MVHLSTCLWFNDQAEEAAKLYTSIFKDGKIGKIARYGKEGFEIHQKPAGTVMTVEFEILGRKFTALNGGDMFKFSEAVSLMVNCDTQAEIDYYWNNFIEYGGQEGPCGWLKDKFGLSWQITPNILGDLMSKGTPQQAEKVTAAYMQMKKFDIAKLHEAYNSAK